MAQRSPAVKQKRNPNDATFRNVTALKKRVKDLEQRVSELEAHRRRVNGPRE